MANEGGKEQEEERVSAYVKAFKWKKEAKEPVPKEEKEEGEIDDSDEDEEVKQEKVEMYHKMGLDATLCDSLNGMTIHEYPTLCIGLALNKMKLN